MSVRDARRREASPEVCVTWGGMLAGAEVRKGFWEEGKCTGKGKDEGRCAGLERRVCSWHKCGGGGWKWASGFSIAELESPKAGTRHLRR